jgi:mono/diheme cytochrome c family protein
MRENCYSCHGGFAGGGMCPSLREPRPDEDEVREVVRNGTRNGMPPFPELTEVDIQNLAAYFQTLRTDREPTFTHWWEPVPTQ